MLGFVTGEAMERESGRTGSGGAETVVELGEARMGRAMPVVEFVVQVEWVERDEKAVAWSGLGCSS